MLGLSDQSKYTVVYVYVTEYYIICMYVFACSYMLFVYMYIYIYVQTLFYMLFNIYYHRQNRVSIYAFEKKAKISLSDRATLRHWNKEIAAESRPKFGYEEVAQPYDLTDNPMSISAVSTSTTPVTATATATTAEESTTVERQRGSSRPSGVDRRRSQVNRPSIALQHEGANPNELHGFIPTWLGGQPFEENRHFSKLEFYIRYIFSIRSLIDIACIMPSYIAYAGTSQGRTSFIRVLRILRIFKLITATKSIMRIIFIVNMSLQRSKDAFIILLMASFAVAIFAGSIMYTIEQGQFVVDSNYPNGKCY